MIPFYIIDYELTALLFGIVLSAYMFFVWSGTDNAQKWMARVCYSLTSGCALDVCAGLTQNNPRLVPVAVTLVLMNLDQLMSATAATCCSRYISASVSEHVDTRVYNRCVNILYIVYLGIRVIALFTTWNVYPGPDGRVATGALEPVFGFIVPGVMMFPGVLLLMFRRRFFLREQTSAVSQAFPVVLFFLLYQMLFTRDTMMSYLIAIIGTYVLFFSVSVPPELLLDENIRRLTERRETARIAAEKAVRADEDARQFLENITHDIRRPMTVLYGVNDDLLRAGRDDPELVSQMDRLYGACDNLLMIAGDLLDFSRMEMGIVTPGHGTFRLTEMMNRLLSDARRRVQNSETGVLLRIDPSLPNLMIGDAPRLEQALRIVLFHATNKTPDGDVIIRVFGEERDNTFPGDTYLNMVYEVVFPAKEETDGEPFRILFARSIIEMMGGRVKRVSTGKEETLYRMELMQEVFYTEKGTVGDAVSVSQADPERNAEPNRFLYAPDLRILIVDDTASNRLVLRAMLGDSEAVVEEAKDGETCLNMAMVNHYDIIVLDEMMPRMSGHEVFLELKKRYADAGKEMPYVIAFTAHAQPDVRERFLRIGFDAFLAKPTRRQELEQTILELLGRRRETE